MMKDLQNALVVVGLSIHFLIILAGLLKNNIQLCYSFFVYHALGFASSLTMTCFIANQEIGRTFYFIKELGLDAVKIAILLELNARMFKYYARVRQSNFVLFIGIAFLLPLYVLLFHNETPSWWGAIPLEIHSRINQVLCLVFLAFAGSILFYRLHIHPRHKFLLIGFLFSQFPLALGYAAAAAFGESHRQPVSLLNATFFVLALLIWSRVYWPPYAQASDSNRSDAGGLGDPDDSGTTK